MSATPDTLATAEVDDFHVVSTHESAEQIAEGLKPDPSVSGEPDGGGVENETDEGLSEAARALGKKGGAAAAAARQAKAKEQTEGDTPDAATAATEPKLGKPRDDPRARMLEATRKEAEAKRKASAAAERAERAEARLAEWERIQKEREADGKGLTAEMAREKAKLEAPGKPKADDFGTYEEFVEAVADWKADQRIQKLQQEAKQQERANAVHQTITRTVESFRGRLDAAAKADPAFLEKTSELAAALQPSFMRAPGEPVKYSHITADAIISSENAPALMLHFSEHPEDLQRVIALQDPIAIERAIARVEGRLEKGAEAAPQPSASKPEVSKARPPVRPVTGALSAAGEPDPDSSNFDEWMEHHNAKEARRR